MAHAKAGLVLAALVAALVAGCTQDRPADADGDGLRDREEESGWVSVIDHLDRRANRTVTSDPRVADTDGDGVDDLYEALLGIDARSSDSDGDGLSDCEEAQHTVRSECEDPDWEGTTDGGLGTNPARADSDPGSSRYASAQPFDDPTGTVQMPRSWGDGIPDGDEVRGFELRLPSGAVRTVRTDPLRLDTDGDLLEDGEERHLYGSDPTLEDSDGDGCRDGRDSHPEGAQKVAVRLRDVQRADGGGSPTGQAIVADVVLAFAPDGAGSATPAAAPSCILPPFHPWARVDLVPTAADGRALDLTSLQPGTATLHWNVRSGQVALQPTGAALVTPLRLEGRDGSAILELTLQGIA